LRMGGLESLREIPGLLTAITAGALGALAGRRGGGVGGLVTAPGLGATGPAPRLLGLVAGAVVWSVGVPPLVSGSAAITLALAKGREGGRHLGRMNAVGQAATLLALGLATLVAWLAPGKHYNAYFLLAGGAILAAAVLCGRLSTHAAGAPRARIILR